MTNHYLIFGLQLSSDIELPELLPHPRPGVPDISVGCTVLHEGGAEQFATGRVGAIEPLRYEFQIARGARFKVCDGERIEVDMTADADPSDVRVWLLGTALGVVLHQRGLLPLHVSAVAVEGVAMAFTGQSGAGKSTLAATLHRRGLPLLTDDVALVTTDEQGATLHPGFPRIKLWSDALDHFELDRRDLIPDLTRTEKYHLRLEPSDGFHAAALPLRRLYLLERSHDDQIHIEPVRGHAAMSLITENTYRVGIAHRMGAAAPHLIRCGEIARRIEVFRFQRPWQLDGLAASTEALLAHMQAPFVRELADQAPG